MGATIHGFVGDCAGTYPCGEISEEAKKLLLAYIEKGKAEEYPMGEVKRQFRSTLGPFEGKKIADAIDKLW